MNRNYLLLLRLFMVLLLGVCTFTSLFAHKPHLKERLLLEVLEELGEKYQVFFSYDPKTVSEVKVDFTLVENESLELAIARLFEKTRFGYKAYGGKYFVIYEKSKARSRKVRRMGRHFKKIQKLESQGAIEVRNNRQILKKEITKTEITVRGKVTSEPGEPLPGASIYIKNTGMGTFSDNEGNYVLNVSENGTLVFTYIGYKDTEIPVNNRTEINVELIEEPLSANELIIVATGYQEISKERSAGAYARANMDVVQNRSTSTNVLDRLNGLVAGLYTNPAPNSEENGDNSILIRGLNSLNANRQPLFVVDGVPISDVSRINPQDVEDIYVLKDATATSIYGARATNGIVVITTKKGIANQKIQIDYDSYVSMRGKPDLDYIPRLNSEQFIQTAREIFDPVINDFNRTANYFNTASVALPPHEEILYDLANSVIDESTADARLNELAGFDNLEQIENLFYRNARLQNHTVSVRGGMDKYSYYGSLSLTDDQNSVPGDDDKSYKVNLNQDYQFNKHIGISLTTDLTHRRLSGKKPLMVNGRTLPYVRFQDVAGNHLHTNFMQYFSSHQLSDFETATGIDLQYVPLDEVDAGYSNGEDFNARVNLGLSIKLFKGLTFEGRYGYVLGNNNAASFADASSYDVRVERAQMVETGPNGPIQYLPADGGHYTSSESRQRDWLVRNQLSYNAYLDEDRHQITLLLGQEAQEAFLSSNRMFIRGFNDRLLTANTLDLESLSSIGLRMPVIPNSGGSSRLEILGDKAPLILTEATSRILSFYGNAGYTFNRKYVLNGSWRIDESNLFGLDKSAQNRPVWSIGVKWLLSGERFLESVEQINELAMRATYGITGNAPIPGTASSFDILSPQLDFLLNAPTLIIASPANNRLSWESTENINLGIDYRLFRYRISGSIDFYQKKTTDLIGLVETNILSGYPSVIANLGDMKNTGLEWMVNTINISGKKFSWATSFNFAYNKNVITKLNMQSNIVTANDIINQRFVEGQPAFTIYAYDFEGLDNMGDPQIKLAEGTITKEPNVALAADARYMGSYLPKVTGGLSNTFTLAGFSLNANMVYSFGAVMRLDGLSSSTVWSEYAGGRLFNGVSRTGLFTVGNVHADIFNRWREPGDENSTNIPAYVVDPTENVARRDTRYYTQGDINVVSADYIKLRDITLIYRIPESISQKVKVENASFRLQLSNVMLWRANDNNIDPEFHDPFLGLRSARFNQETITAGIHITL